VQTKQEAKAILAVRMTLTDFERLQALALRRGMLTRGGRPVLSQAASAAIRAGLDLAEREEVARDCQK